MILRTRYGGVRELRAAEFGNSLPPPRTLSGLTWTGKAMDVEGAHGVDAFYSGVRLIAETIALMPMAVYRRDAGGIAEKARNAWQYALVHDSPNEHTTAFNFFEDVFSQLEGCGNSFALKMRQAGRVSELYLLDPDAVKVEREKGVVRYRVRLPGESYDVVLAASEVLHFRGPTLKGGFCGVGVVTLHRHTLGIASALDEFQGRFFENDARPGVVLKFPEKVTPKQAAEWAEQWDEAHRGVGKAHRTGVMGAGGDVVTIPISLSDAQFIEAQNQSVEKVGRILRLPRSFMNLDTGTSQATPAQDFERLLKVALLPRMRRVEQAFAKDPDLFGTPDLFPEFIPDALLRADAATRYAGYKNARQGGWVTANQIRAWENMPPHENGDVLLETPVGGAPNPGPHPDPAAVE